MRKERKTAKETFVLIKTGFPFPEREFAVEKHFFKTGLTFLSVLTNIYFLNIACGTVYCKLATTKNHISSRSKYYIRKSEPSKYVHSNFIRKSNQK